MKQERNKFIKEILTKLLNDIDILSEHDLDYISIKLRAILNHFSSCKCKKQHKNKIHIYGRINKFEKHHHIYCNPNGRNFKLIKEENVTTKFLNSSDVCLRCKGQYLRKFNPNYVFWKHPKDTHKWTKEKNTEFLQND